jgi:hypothetical protein
MDTKYYTLHLQNQILPTAVHEKITINRYSSTKCITIGVYDNNNQRYVIGITNYNISPGYCNKLQPHQFMALMTLAVDGLFNKQQTNKIISTSQYAVYAYPSLIPAYINIKEHIQISMAKTPEY